MTNMGKIVEHFLGGQIPLASIQSVKDWYEGAGNSMLNAGKVLGPFAGLTFSKGAPGGEAVGQMYAARERHDYAVQEAMPDIRRMIQTGQIEMA